MNDQPTLREYANDYEITRWTVAKVEGDFFPWCVFDPTPQTDYDPGGDDAFRTFAEAIDYAQRQARS